MKKKTPQQKRRETAKRKIYYEGFDKGWREEQERNQITNQKQYDSFLKAIEDLKSSRRIFSDVKDDVNVQKIDFSIALIEKLIEDIFIQPYSSIRPKKKEIPQINSLANSSGCIMNFTPIFK